MLAQAAFARGQWRKAKAEVDAAARLDPVPALELWSLLASLPFIPLPDSEVVAARAAVRRWKPGIESADQHSSAHTGLHPMVRLHRLALLDIRLGDTVAALREARALDRPGDASTRGRLAHTLAQSIRAHVAAAGGRFPEALTLIQGAGWEVAAPVFVSEAYDRFFRAELLERLGREDEALGWYGSIAERAAYELVYLAPSVRHQAEIAERRGQREAAAKYYRRFAELWKEADPELQSQVGEARRSLAAIQ
jgi:tetratricopeptide (TPR) repeat protein